MANSPRREQIWKVVNSPTNSSGRLVTFSSMSGVPRQGANNWRCCRLPALGRRTRPESELRLERPRYRSRINAESNMLGLRDRGVMEERMEVAKPVFRFRSSLMVWWVIQNIQDAKDEKELAEREELLFGLSKRQVDKVKSAMALIEV